MEANNPKAPETLVEALKQKINQIVEATKKEAKVRIDPSTTSDSFKKVQKIALWIFIISSLASHLPITWPVLGPIVVAEWVEWVIWGSGFLAGVAGLDKSKLTNK